MVNKFILLFAVSILISSCSNKVGLVKRKYNKGFFVNVSNKNKATKNLIEKSEVKTANHQETIREEIVLNTTVENVKPVKQEAIPFVEKTATPDKNIKPCLIASSGKTEIAVKTKVKSIEIQNQGKSTKSSKGKSDVNKVVMIILCLFPIICLIPVYLHDGSITLSFWIDLLLHLTFIGAIIFALLVVLDVVDLS